MYTTWKKLIIMIIITRFGIEPGIYKTIIAALSQKFYDSLIDEYQKSYTGTRRSLCSWTVLPSFFFSFLTVWKHTNCEFVFSYFFCEEDKLNQEKLAVNLSRVLKFKTCKYLHITEKHETFSLWFPFTGGRPSRGLSTHLFDPTCSERVRRPHAGLCPGRLRSSRGLGPRRPRGMF